LRQEFFDSMDEAEIVQKINEIWKETNNYKKFVAKCDQCGEIGRYGAPQWAEKCCAKHESYKKYAGHITSFDLDSSQLCTVADISGTKANTQRNCDLERLVENPEHQKYFSMHTSDLALVAFADEIGYRLNNKRDPEKFNHNYNKQLHLRSNAISRELRRREREDQIGTHSLIFFIQLPKTIPALPEVIAN